MFQPLPINLKSGFMTESTPLASAGRYIGGNLVRFWKGSPERWGGWQKLTNRSTVQPPRGAHAWRTLDGYDCIAWGTADHLWLYANNVLYDITPVGLGPGLVDTISASSWGGGSLQGPTGWGSGYWGGSIPIGAVNGGNASTWSLDNYGQDLIACRRGGTVYHWDRTLGFATPATAIPGAPATALGVFITESSRHMVVLGAHDGTSDQPLRVQWPSRETLSSWTPTDVNTAGDMLLERSNELIGRISVTGGDLLLTDTSVYLMQFLGGQLVFGFHRLGGAGLVGPLAGAEVDGVAYWWGNESFMTYAGRIQVLPCDVHRYVFENVNQTQSHKICCGRNRKFNSVIWFYPSANSRENDSYVEFSLNDGWTFGKLARTTWIDDGIFSRVPIATTPEGNIYLHETGATDDGAPFKYYLETSEIEIGGPANAAQSPTLIVRKFVPDYERLSGAATHTLTIEERNYPNAPARTKGPYVFDATKKQFSVRARTRLARLRFDGSDDFRMGQPRMMVSTGAGDRE